MLPKDMEIVEFVKAHVTQRKGGHVQVDEVIFNDEAGLIGIVDFGDGVERFRIRGSQEMILLRAIYKGENPADYLFEHVV